MLQAILGGASILGKLLGGGGEGASKERMAQNQFLQNENRMRADLYGTQQQALQGLLGLQERGIQDRARMGVEAPSARMRQALLASLIQHARPTTFQGAPVNIPRGTSPLAAIDQGARGGAGELQRQALLALLTKSDVPAATDYAKTGMLTPPQMAAYKKAGKGESFMSGAGLLGGLLGGLGPLLQRRRSNWDGSAESGEGVVG